MLICGTLEILCDRKIDIQVYNQICIQIYQNIGISIYLYIVMKLSPSSSKQSSNPTGPRLRKKHKRLDAICEDEYSRNHSETNADNDRGPEAGPASSMSDMDLRRSSRVRRAPVLLDVSPTPTRKRRKIDKTVDSGIYKRKSKIESVKEEKSEESVSPGIWGSRLRSRERNKGYKVKNEDTGDSSRSKKLFGEILEKNGVEDGNSLVVRKKRRERVREEILLRIDVETCEVEEDRNGEEKEVEICEVKEESYQKDEMEVIDDENEEVMAVSASRLVGENERVSFEGDAKDAVEEEERDVSRGKEIEDCVEDDNAEMLDKIEIGDTEEEQLEDRGSEENGKNGGEDDQMMYGLEDRSGDNNVDSMEKTGQPQNEGEQLLVALGGGVQPYGREEVGKSTNEDGQDGCLEKTDNAEKRNKFIRTLDDTLGRPRIKQGRRCGLCGGGTDGKPPKRLIQDVGDSEHEAYSGSSASEEPNYDVWDGFGDEPGWLGCLLGPINDRYGIAGIWVHQHCAVWSPEVYFAGLGCLKNVRAALCRGKALKCTRCGRPGATIGCRVDRCPRTYHLPCARANGCVFDHRKFLIACTDHRYLFQPHGNNYVARIKKLKSKKMKLELRKLSNDALRKDIEAEEKWLENCGEDEEFLKRESKRLHRDLLRIAPVYIGGSNSESGQPFEGWDSVAGLQDVVRCMKEVVILPLLYPEFFNNMGLTPPRGVLLHGYPGTGKTHVVRALIGSCARGDKQIAYFARKGADCLGKYVGDAERQLRLLFQVAEKCQPSIIFFDEIDGLAPCRTRQQDQTHSSVVSTLLALMDGLKSRGSVVVIGATNRPEAVDPALRRPGRFDREIYFPLPSTEDRASILSLHTKRWPKPIAGNLLKVVARRTAGFAGADLQALCTQAAIIALKRNFPLKEVLSAAEEKSRGGKCVPLPSFTVDERDWLEAISSSPPPSSRRVAGIAAYNLISSPLPTHLIPCFLQPLSALLVSLHLDERLWLPPPLAKAASAIKTVIISALKKKKVATHSWWSHVDDLLQEANVAKEVEKKLSHDGIVLAGEASVGGFDDSAGDINEDSADYEPSILHSGFMQNSTSRNVSIISNKKSGFRILIAGCPGSGQSHLAACLLHFFIGNVEIQKIDLATVSQEGHDDISLGLAQILMKCASVKSCMVFMPRIDLWAVENDLSSADHPLSSNGNSPSTGGNVFGKEIDSFLQQLKPSESTESLPPSAAWSSFIEQVESICVSTSLMIVATSEVPYTSLPKRVRQFFKSHGSNCNPSISSKHTVPRFLVKLGGNFNRDMVIDVYAEKLSRDIIQLVVQLIQQRTHACINSYKEPEIHGSMEDCTENDLVNDGEARAQSQGGTLKKVFLPPSDRVLKGRSNIFLATSTLGYQILRYPHFAELCWFTSKLKEGPCADVSGPWKGWPFNTCIIRSSDSVEKGAVSCGSSNIKSKEKSGSVRGLIAVGLLAYRGMYASLREVCFDVRRVFELLVEEINVKIEAGKDRYRYVRLLSQVAFLEDMVNGWAYSLQSLEFDPQMKGSNPQFTATGCPDNSQACMDNLTPTDQCGPNVSNKTPQKSERQEGSSQVFANQTTVCLGLNNGRVSERTLDASAVTCKSVGDIPCYQNGTYFEQQVSERAEDVAVVYTDSHSFEHANGFALPESLTENNPPSSSELGDSKFSNHLNTSGQLNGLPMTETSNTQYDGKYSASGHVIEVDHSSAKSDNHSAAPELICIYRCCSKCLYTLQKLTRKIINCKVESDGSDWTLEDIRDVVASLSANLLSAVGKLYSSNSNSYDENPSHESDVELPECPGLDICDCKRRSIDSLFSPTECSCHSSSGCLPRENTQSGFDLEFVFRDGLLIPVHSNKDFTFHCTFEKLCLCALIKSVLMKWPFD